MFFKGGQVQTSVNGLTIQNGLTTNLVNAKAATGEEVPEQVNSNIFGAKNNFIKVVIQMMKKNNLKLQWNLLIFTSKKTWFFNLA